MRYNRNRIYIPTLVQEKIKDVNILLAGCGIGSVIAECALRMGFENITLVDGDNVELTLPVCKERVNIWHVGRFAISQKENTGGILLLKKLLVLVIHPICQKSNSIMIAECDSKFVKILNMLGIQTQVLGQGISYLGSETLPIYTTSEWLKVFLDRNEHLISSNILDLNDHLIGERSIA